MEARDRPNSPAQIFAWRKEVRARLIADRLSIDPADRRQYAGKIALHLSRFIEPLSKRTVSFYWPFRGEPDLRPLIRRGRRWTLRAPGRRREKGSTCLSPLEAWRKARSGHLEYSDPR
jgi:5-formyltetrahydrofolate cyclo-ligase